jgi:hypothetical protein
MELGVGDILAEIARELHLNGTPIVLQWNTLSGGTLPDPVDGTVPASALTPQTAIHHAFVHQISQAGRSQVKQFNEIAEGDLILDFAADVAIDAPSGGALRDLVFVVKGKAYVAKEISEKLAQSWDVTIQDRQLFRSVLVRVRT